jgi:hypothetical protein
MLYLIAGNGSPNFGDELIVQNWLRFYRDNGYSGPIVVDGKGAKATESLLRGFGEVEFVKKIPRHADGVDGLYEDFFALGSAYGETHSSEFSNVVAIHFLGGGYASANWYNATRVLGAAAAVAKKWDIPLVATGLGIAPFNVVSQSGKEAWRSVVESFSIFECRDLESYRALLEICGRKAASGLRLGLDDAFLYPVPVKRHSGRWLHLSGFTPRAFLGSSSADSFAEFMNIFDKVVFWTCSKPDAALYPALVAAFPRIERYGNERLLNSGMPLMREDFMITGRFHPHLEAARRGMSGYFSADSGFYRTKHGLLLQLGSNFRAAPDVLADFSAEASVMVKADAGRVEEKRRVGEQILSLIGLPSLTLSSSSREAQFSR